MNLPFYIAKRYLISKKSQNIINIISGISISGITIGTIALIVVLSVFNGFESLILSMFNSFNPDIQITASKGKTISLNTFPKEDLQKIKGIIHYNEVIEENILIQYNKKQHIGYIKGVSDNFIENSGIDKNIIRGEAQLKVKGIDFALVGTGIAYHLDLRDLNLTKALIIHAPNREKGYNLSMQNSFNQKSIFPAGVFSVQQEIDDKYIITPIEFARELLNYKNEVSAIEIGIQEDYNLELIQKEITNLLGNGYKVKTRFEQQALLYKILKSEKWAIFLILTFILIIATFNVIGSLSMLILDKKKDIKILGSMGASDRLIRKIFLLEGSLISLSGAVLGIVLGMIICWAQIQFNLVKLGQNNGTFIINSYPVEMHLTDIIFVFITVCLIGIGAAWIPVRQISRKHLSVKLG